MLSAEQSFTVGSAWASEAFNSVFASNQIRHSRYLAALNAVVFKRDQGLTSLSIDLLPTISDQYRSTLIRRLRSSLYEILASIDNTANFESAEVNNVFKYRRRLEALMAKRLDRCLSKLSLPRAVEWRYNYYLLSDKQSDYRELCVVVDSNIKNLPINKLQDSLNRMLKGSSITAIISKGGIKRELVEGQPIAVRRHKINFGSISQSRLNLRDVFISKDSDRPIITIDDSKAQIMEDGIFVRQVSKRLSYCSVYIPLRLSASQITMLPLKEVVVLGVEFLFNRRSKQIIEPRVGLSEVMSQERMTFNELDANWHKLRHWSKIQQHSRAGEIIRNLQDSLVVALAWQSAQEYDWQTSSTKNNNLKKLNLNSGQPGSVIVANLIEMAQTVVANFLVEHRRTFLALTHHYHKISDIAAKTEEQRELQLSILERAKNLKKLGQRQMVVAPEDCTADLRFRAPFKRGMIGEINQRQILSVINPVLFPALSTEDIKKLTKQV